MPYASRYYEKEFISFVEKYVISKNINEINILDVGCGSGYYADLFYDRWKIKIDGVEVWNEYIRHFDLQNKYKNLYEIDIVNFTYQKYYDLVIFGDIIEHLSTHQAQNVLHTAYNSSNEFWIQIPFKYKQGIIENNPYEEHKQDNLDECLMKQNYGRYLNLRHYNFNIEGMFGLAIYDKYKN